MVELESELGGSISHRSVSPLGSPKMVLEETCSRVPPPYLSLPPGPTNPLDKKNPSGKTMLERQHKVRDLVERQLRNYPQCKGDDTLGILRFWAKEQPEQIEAIVFILRHWAYGRDDEVPSWVFPKLLRLTCPETYRRRREEIQSPEREAVEKGLVRFEDTIYLPHERTVKKRERLRRAMRNEFAHETNINDWLI